MLFDCSCDEGSIQEPVMHGLVPEGNTANMFSSVHIPRANADPQLLWNCVVVPAVHQGLLERDGGWSGGGTELVGFIL